VINRGHARESVFHDDEDRSRFVQLLGSYRDRFEPRLYHYCLMDNHFHLLVQLPEPRRLSALMAGLLVAYWHHYRRRYALVGHLFQGRFKSTAIEADEYLLRCGRYIERNPLRAGMVVQPWDYAWSSCRAYALGMADSLLAPNPWYEAFASEAATRQTLWRAFLIGDDPKEKAVRVGSEADWIVGSQPFRQQMRRPGARPAPRARGRPIEPCVPPGGTN
jgi:putative transposase